MFYLSNLFIFGLAGANNRQLPRPEGQSLQLYSLNPYEINARYIGHQERVSWPNRLPVGRVDTSDQEVALARQPYCIRTAPRLLCDAAQLPGGAKRNARIFLHKPFTPWVPKCSLQMISRVLPPHPNGPDFRQQLTLNPRFLISIDGYSVLGAELNKIAKSP